MNCSKCGFKIPDDSKVCPFCGQAVDSVSVNTAANVVFAALKDNLFLAICILITANSAIMLLTGSIQLLQILFAVFLWLTYASAQRGYVDAKNLRCVSGTAYAQYVIINVAATIFIVSGILTAVTFSSIVNTAEFMDVLNATLAEFDLSLNDVPQAIISAAEWIFGLVFVIAGAVVLVINLLGMRKIHRFAKSVYMGVMYQNPNFENPIGAKNWLMAFGVLSGLSAISSLMNSQTLSALAIGCEAAATIIASILIGKYLVKNDVNM